MSFTKVRSQAVLALPLIAALLFCPTVGHDVAAAKDAAANGSVVPNAAPGIESGCEKVTGSSFTEDNNNASEWGTKTDDLDCTGIEEELC